VREQPKFEASRLRAHPPNSFGGTDAWRFSEARPPNVDARFIYHLQTFNLENNPAIYPSTPAIAARKHTEEGSKEGIVSQDASRYAARRGL
jgi:hypothetical protein